MPSALKAALNELLLLIDEWDGTDSVILPPTIDMATAVPMAALILDYPIAYIPTATPANPSPNFLCGVSVRTYECVLTYQPHSTAPNESRERVSVMRFSCPKDLGEDKGVSLEAIVSLLHRIFKERVAKTGDKSAAFEIVCDTVTCDRLAL